MDKLFLKYLYRIAYFFLRILWRFTNPVTVGVRVLMVKNGHVVLVRHSYQPAWYLPGGLVEQGETIEQAARREAREETGATLGALRLFGVYTSFNENKSDHTSVLVCTDFTYTGKGDAEIDQVKAFPLDQLPEDLSEGHRRRVEDYIKNPQYVGLDMW